MDIDSRLDSARQVLLQVARQNRRLTYQEFARRCEITKPPVISQATQLLEQLMAYSTQRDLPVFAALVVQKNGHLPRPGFFQKLQEMGVTEAFLNSEAASLWHQKELEKIQQWIKQYDN